jgi:hypothetical protein
MARLLPVSLLALLAVLPAWTAAATTTTWAVVAGRDVSGHDLDRAVPIESKEDCMALCSNTPTCQVSPSLPVPDMPADACQVSCFARFSG